MIQHITISNLRHRPEFIDTVAARVWDAWWRARGYSFADIAARVRENLNDVSIPFALVAHDGIRFSGTVSVIASDMSERPLYTPWIAALWVDPEYRRKGIGEALVAQAFQFLLDLGHRTAYLCTTRENRDFYLARGWSRIEEDVGDKLLTIMIKSGSNQ